VRANTGSRAKRPLKPAHPRGVGRAGQRLDAADEDGFWRPDVRAPFKTDDGEIVLMHYTGLVEQTDAFNAAAEADQPTQWKDQ
jgi:hypothetical protein